MKLTDRIFDLFTDRIWTIDTSSCSKAYAAMVRHIKVIRVTIDTFTQNRMGFQCVALSYFVTLAIIPLVALIFAITGDLGLSEKISEILHRFFANNPEYIDIIMDKASEAKKQGEEAAMEASRVYDSIQQFKKDTQAEIASIRNRDEFGRPKDGGDAAAGLEMPTIRHGL